MDGSQFDALARSLIEARSRRGLTRLLGGLAFGGPLTVLGAEETRAKKKRKKRKKRRASCSPQCTGIACGPDGCGGTCGTCIGGSCSAGACVCPNGTENCGGACFNTGGDPRNCGACGQRCRINEVCIADECRCLAFPEGTCDASDTCCAAACICVLDEDAYLDPSTCRFVASCPPGATPCMATSSNCGTAPLRGPARVCCPSGTTCTPQGTCLR